MGSADSRFSIDVTGTGARCPVGEIVGERNIADGKIPVLSCEGGCIRGEIARMAAHIVAKEEGFARACHGELLSVPGSAMARWAEEAEKVVLIDGCFLRCHGRLLENLIDGGRLAEFDALSIYRDYTDVFEIDAVPEGLRKQAARQVADSVLAALTAEKA
jgi:hypothetical protein